MLGKAGQQSLLPKGPPGELGAAAPVPQPLACCPGRSEFCPVPSDWRPQEEWPFLEAQDPQPAGPQPRLTAAPAQSSRAAHLLEVAPFHGAVLHLSEVHVTEVVCRLPLEGTASVRHSPLPTSPLPAQTAPRRQGRYSSSLQPQGSGPGILGSEVGQPLDTEHLGRHSGHRGLGAAGGKKRAHSPRRQAGLPVPQAGSS